MKISFLFTVLIFFNLNASVFSQNEQIKIDVNSGTLNEVLLSIEEQSKFKIFYKNGQIDIHQPISISLKNLTVEEILDVALEGSGISYTIIENVVVLSPDGNAQSPNQEKTITGKVISLEDQQGLPGVNVVVKGTLLGTVTDVEGNYTIQIEDGESILVFSSVGFVTEEVVVENKSVIDVSLSPDITALNEIVVIGYGVQRKSDLTGSVAKVKSEDIAAAPVSRIDQALRGKAAGVRVVSNNGSPGAGASIRIRGGNSITASNEPLYVIDGFIGGGDLNSINPADIESIEILKDASATAIYGARGANGVILITTKKGLTGKPKINVNAYYGSQRLPQKIDMLTGPERAAYAVESDEFTGAPITYPDLSKVTHTDWQDAVTQIAPISNVHLSVSGGQEKTDYFFSASYFNQEGIIINSGFERFQTRLNINTKINNWLSFGANLNFSRSDRANSTVNLFTVLKDAATSLPIYDENGDYNIVNPLSGQLFENPVAQARLQKNNTYKTRFLGNWYAKASFKNGLTIKSTIGADINNSKQNIYTPGSLPRRMDQELGGYAKISTSSGINLLNENTVSYVKDVGKHSFNLLGGATIQHAETESLWASADGFTNDLLEYNKLSTGDPELRLSDSGFSDWTMVSFLGRVNYSYNDKYLFTASVRQDGSSRLAKNHKWAFFPSAAAAWRLGEEDFIKDLGVFYDLKLRASYGKTGNQAIGIYSTLPTLGVTKFFFNENEYVGYRQGNLANDDLKWETTDQYSLGLDAALLDGKLSFEIDAYYKKTNDLLLSVEMPGTTGYTGRIDNVGSVENKGIEFMLNAVVMELNDFTWDLSFNIAANRNKVLDLGTEKGFRDVRSGARLIEGESAVVFYGAVYEGTWKSQEEIDALPGYMVGAKPGYPKFKDVNENGKYDGFDDYDIIGSPEANFFGGLSSNFSYKNFGLDIYFNYSYGNDILNTMSPKFFFGGFASNIHADARNRWTEDNTTSDIPRAGSHPIVNVNTPAYSISVHDGSFLRLQTLRLSYTLPTKNISWLSKASIYTTGENLWLLTNYDYGFDPEVNAVDNDGIKKVANGFDGSSYPQNRTFIIGVNVEF
ncbi:MAG: TonB-dependent receptor [Cytophagales bacterium]|nr:TonB-dependent receptor [Cytophagales bacterium]